MTQQRPTPTRRNPSKPSASMRADRDRQARDAAAEQLGAMWRELCQNEPVMIELLLPQKMRDALSELARVTGS